MSFPVKTALRPASRDILDNIERIPPPAPAVFQREYVRAMRPVIVTGLFDGQPVRQLDTLERAVSALGALRFRLRPEYFSFLTAHYRPGAWAEVTANWLSYGQNQEVCSLAEYVQLLAATPDTKLMCSEWPLPEDLARLFAWPDYCRTGDEQRDADRFAYLFVGNAGNSAHFHFDGDYHHVLHYNLCGAKRFCLVPAQEARKLQPLDQYSTLMFEHFSEAEQVAFLRYANGYDCVLRPGETLFIPATMWHAVEYLETSVSFNLRFGRNRYRRFMCDYLPINYHAQNLCALMHDEAAFEKAYPGVMARLAETRFQEHPGTQAKYEAVQRLLAQLYREICCGNRQPELFALSEAPGLLHDFRRYRTEHIALRYLA